MAETKNDSFHLRIAVLELLLLEISERAHQVGIESLRRLVRELHGPVQDSDRNSIVRVCGEEEAEVRVGALNRVPVHLLLELGAPLRHQVDILEHNPMALLV